MAATTEKKPHIGRVMVIGGCGFLGHHIINLILRSWDASALSVVDLRCQRNRRPDSDGVVYFEADITDSAKLTTIFEEAKPDVVIHTASPLALSTGKAANAIYKKVNVDGTASVIEACRVTGVKALVFTSSASIISDNQTDLINADERWPVLRGKQQTVYYSETKAMAEDLILAANKTSSPGSSTTLLTTSLRPAGILGEGGSQAISAAIEILRTNRTGFQLGSNTNLFDFTYVENVAHAHLLAAQALLVTHQQSKTAPVLDHEKIDGEVFFITNDEPTYFWDYTRYVYNEAGADLGLDHVWVIPREIGVFLGHCSEWANWLLRRQSLFTAQTAVFSNMTRYYNIDKAKRRLGYEPIVSFQEGLRRSTRWVLEQEKLELEAKKVKA